MRTKFSIFKTKKGFTLIELLVVISIIGLLMSFLFVSYSGAQKQTRDAQRKSNLSQYRAALEALANVNNDYYPSYTSNVPASGSLCSTSLAKVISACPDDPRKADDSTFVYNYQSNGTGGGTTTATQYVLWTKLEETQDFWVICSKGKTGVKTQQGFSVSGGACPI